MMSQLIHADGERLYVCIASLLFSTAISIQKIFLTKFVCLTHLRVYPKNTIGECGWNYMKALYPVTKHVVSTSFPGQNRSNTQVYLEIYSGLILLSIFQMNKHLRVINKYHPSRLDSTFSRSVIPWRQMFYFSMIYLYVKNIVYSVWY